MFPFRFKENIYPLRLQAFYKACNAALHLGGGGQKPVVERILVVLI